MDILCIYVCVYGNIWKVFNQMGGSYVCREMILDPRQQTYNKDRRTT